jgi:hypothetical protein
MRMAGRGAVWLGVWVLAAAAPLVGCDADAGTKPPSEFCKAVDSLGASVTQINQNSLSKSSVSAVQTSLATIGNAVDNVRATAEPEFSDQVDAVDAAASTLEKTVTAAVDQPNPSNMDAARTSMRELTSATEDLSKSTSQGC